MSTSTLTDSGSVMMNGSPSLREHDVSGYTFAPLSRREPTEAATQLLSSVLLYDFCKLSLLFKIFSWNVFFSIIMKFSAFLCSSFAISADFLGVPIVIPKAFFLGLYQSMTLATVFWWPWIFLFFKSVNWLLWILTATKSRFILNMDKLFL